MGTCCSRYSLTGLYQYNRQTPIYSYLPRVSEATLDACEEVIDILYGLRRFPTPHKKESLYDGNVYTDTTEIIKDNMLEHTTYENDNTDDSFYGTPMSQ